MRGFKALWRLALSSCKERPGPRDGRKETAEAGARPRKVKDNTAFLLDAEPPTHTLQ